MAYRTPAPLHTVGILVRALLGLALLAALLVGTPYVLLLVGTQPTDLSGGIDVLLRPDDGTLFFTAITCIGWVAWAAFALSVVLEIVAVTRRRSAPRLRGLGGLQSMASFLVGGIVLLAPTAASAATSTPAHAVTATQTVSTSTTSATSSTPTATENTNGPNYTVSSSTELPWDLAEKYLGSGQRWQDIAALNPDIPGLAAGDHYLPKGAVIKLPADACPAQATHTTNANAAASKTTASSKSSGQNNGREYVVQPGDYLSKIAQRQLGDAAEWPELFEANKGEQQPHGHTFSNPDLIFPGQELTLPADANAPSETDSSAAHDTARPGDKQDSTPHTPATEAPHEGAQQGGEAREDHATATPGQGSEGRGETSQAPSHGAETVPKPSASHSPDHATTPSQRPETQSPETAQPTPSTSSSPSSTTTNSPAPTSTGEAQQGDNNGSLIGAVGLAASGVFAAAVLLTLGTRRLLQRRGLRRGNRIPMPTGRAAATELALRSVDASVELQLLDAMLRTAALNLAKQDGVLPELVAVRLGEQGVLLHLAEETEPVAPFTTADGTAASTVWWCPSTTDQLLDGDELREIDPPYPGLLALGAGDDNSIVLVDLEQLGAIHLTGERRQQVLRMAAIALALSPLGGQIELAVAGEDTAPGLTMLDQHRITPHPDLARALDAFAAHQAEQQRTLIEFGPAGLAVARLEEEVEELWPMVLLADLDACPDPDVIGRGWELLDDQPYAALAMLTSSTDVPVPDDVWVVDTDAEYVTVPGTDVQCTLSGCSDDEYADVLELVLTADLPVQPDVPSPPAPAPVAASDDETGSAAGAGGDEGVLLVKSTSGSASPTALSSGPVGPLAAIADLEDGPEGDDGAEETPPGPAEPAVAGLPDRSVAAGPRSAGSANGLESAREAAATDAPGDHGLLTPQPSESSGTVAPASLPLPRVSVRLPQSTDDSAVPAAAPSAASDGPVVRVLGAVGLDGAHGDILSNRKTTALELAAWLVLHPGANAHQVDEVLAPHGRISRDTRNSRIRELRKWLGNDADGVLHLPHIATQPDKLFRLAGVDCDWLTFQQLVDDRSGDDTARELRLKSALDLVGGRPFSGIPARRYVWAEDITQDIIKKIVHAADELAERRLQHGDGRSALWAANRGLHVAREAEQLWRHRFRAHALLGQDEELEDAIRALEALLLELGCSMDDETDEVLRLLQAARR
ncbi:LysM peptidoglycan-binding domain-containing protein [Streptomyces mirabilis]|uniref:LysM peptidoglycan-binding domain-containing protein n=1 Tax=Streptomyces mirabilis TaxID=68239 RepID=UPI00368BEFDF